ncbi:hypothetical protein LCGC14_2638610 [marine sediment metagenome]|uniref:N-acetyltransferase domain-containing protein n=1 Tax=marine sediment metagenome TaxID=412755 RepID=A0A0F8ZY66_9ZZZZ
MTEVNEKTEEGVFPFIEGNTIDLVASNSKWANLLCKWSNDPRVRHYARNVWPNTLENVKKWFEPASERGAIDFIIFIIYHKKDKKPIGNVGLSRINWLNRNANIFALIGFPEYWGRGIAGEAAELVIKYGFTELNLHKIYCGVYDPNKRSLRAAEKLGFKEEAVLKEEIYVDGKYADEHKFALFKEEWLERNT